MRRLKPKPHGLLSPEQLLVLQEFFGMPDSQRFYLTGGTALAEFYLGHRRSYDLDLFTTEEGLVLPFSRAFETRFKEAGLEVRTIRRLASFAEFIVSAGEEKIRVQLAYDSPYRFHPPEDTSVGKVNDFVDLAVDKLLAFYGRAEPRDAVDLFFLLKWVDLRELLDLAGKKDPGFDTYWLAAAFQQVQGFPDEPERWPVDMVLSWEPRAVKAQFSSYAHEILDSIREGEFGKGAAGD